MWTALAGRYDSRSGGVRLYQHTLSGRSGKGGEMPDAMALSLEICHWPGVVLGPGPSVGKAKFRHRIEEEYTLPLC